MDLAEGRLPAINAVNSEAAPLEVFNLGTGLERSVLDMLKGF